MIDICEVCKKSVGTFILDYTHKKTFCSLKCFKEWARKNNTSQDIVLEIEGKDINNLLEDKEEDLINMDIIKSYKEIVDYWRK